MGLTEREQEKLHRLARKAGIKLPDIQGYQKLSKEQIETLNKHFEEANGAALVIMKRNGGIRIYTVKSYLATVNPDKLKAAHQAKQEKATTETPT